MAKNRRVVAGLDNGYCRICGAKATLSDDHVLPEKCGNNGVVRIHHGEKTVYSQNGMCFRTLCKECNSKRLGAETDPELIRVFKEVKGYLSSPLLGPYRFLQLHVNSDLLLKSMMGHFLATYVVDGSSDDLKSDLDYTPYYEGIRQFVLGKKPLGEKYECYYWLYQGSETMINHYAAVMPDPSSLPGGVIYGSVFKSFPLGFWIVNSVASNLVPKRPRLLPVERDCLVTLDRVNLLPLGFPEMPGAAGISVLSSKAMFKAQRLQTKNEKR
jgi:hypothetical protein